jgi:DNA-binding YbaB/EbfC family protein
MSQPDLRELMEQAQQMQSRLAAAQRELARRRVEASAGGGMVTAVATGELRIAEIRVEPGVWESGDRALLQDLITAAVNAALGRAQQMVQEELQRLALAPGGLPTIGGG